MQASTPHRPQCFPIVVFFMDRWLYIIYSDIMLSGIRIYSSDPIWRQILAELNATVLDAAGPGDLNFDTLDITPPISVVELKAAILSAGDVAHILRRVFGCDVSLSRLHSNIVSHLYKSGGMRAAELKTALGYSPDTSTHTVDTAIYQLRKLYGRDFIINTGGVYRLGRL